MDSWIRWKCQCRKWQNNLTKVGCGFLFSVHIFHQSLQWTFSIVLLTEPEQPVDIVATRRGTSQLNVTWTLRNGNVTYYSVNIFNTALNYTSSNTTQTREAIFTGLQPGRVYEVTVTAVAGNFRNQSAQVQLATSKSWSMMPILCIYCSLKFIKVCMRVWECFLWFCPEEKAKAPNVCLCEWEFVFATSLASLLFLLHRSQPTWTPHHHREDNRLHRCPMDNPGSNDWSARHLL